KAPPNLIGPRSAGQIRICGEPAGGVARHVKLRHHADATVARVGDDVPDLLLRVVPPAGRHLLQFGKALAFYAKALIVRKMPVQNVELYGFHGVEIAFYGL